MARQVRESGFTEVNEENKDMRKRFCELAVGARFEFRGRRYEKMSADIGRDEERGGNAFHAGTEVVVDMGAVQVRSAECGVQSLQRLSRVHATGRRVEGERAWTPAKGAQRAAQASPPSEERKEVAEYWVRPMRFSAARPRHVRTRLGREPGRELRPYGTV